MSAFKKPTLLKKLYPDKDVHKVKLLEILTQGKSINVQVQQ